MTDYFWVVKREEWRVRRGELAAYENDLIEFIFDDLAKGGDAVSIEIIKKSRNKFVKFFSHWQKEVKKQAEANNYYDRQSIRGTYYSLGMAAVLLLLTVGAAILFGPWTVVLAATTGMVFILSFFITHRTSDGEREAQGWKSFKRYLQKYQFRAADRSEVLSRIDLFFVYGIVLGAGKKIYSELAALVPSESYNHYIPWYVYHGGTGSFSADSFSTAFSSMIATTSSAMSTATGTGGGASAGGGGGAGAGGGGAG